jgi:hypothetical protein
LLTIPVEDHNNNGGGFEGFPVILDDPLAAVAITTHRRFLAVGLGWVEAGQRLRFQLLERQVGASKIAIALPLITVAIGFDAIEIIDPR